MTPSAKLPALQDEPLSLSDDELISEFFLTLTVERAPDLTVCDEIRCRFEAVRSQIWDLMFARDLMVFGFPEWDMRERARRKAAGEALPVKASCGDPRFPDPFPTVERACIHMEHQLAHLDNCSVERMCFDDQELVFIVWRQAHEMALSAGEADFPFPWRRAPFVVDLAQYQRLREGRRSSPVA